jgi:hypothetical protein
MAVSDTGVVVIGYYDQSNSQFVIKYSDDGSDLPTALNTANPNTDPSWSTAINIPVQYVGWYPSMVIDSSGRVHISAYDSSNAALSYILMSSIDDDTPTVVTVDTFNSVGYFSEIKLDGSGQPWIAYYNSSETGTRNALRLASYSGSLVEASLEAGVDENDYATGAWEIRTIPVGSVPQGSQSSFLKVNLGFDTNDNPIVGYMGDSLEYSVPLDEVL